ncbi:MAG: GIY-YIG nuclease family protein [Candidatus Saccharibacteria bacterium]|nr:GIY-YIG nuclease family protein [Candidatus Saccharibacteria bacterium]MDO4979268.1 GIY-YIG nuclease family protein [Candidatus Saccharibacteria bacterium]
MDTIKLNDILQLDEEQLDNAKIRFMVPSDRIGFNPNLDAEDTEKQNKINLEDLVFNRQSSISFREGVIAIGFIRIRDDYWLMTGIVKVIKDNGLAQPATAEYLTKKYNFRLVVKFHKDFQNGIVKANTIIDQLEVIELWNPEKGLGEKAFPGYKNVTVGYKELKKKIELSDEWRTALKSRKGVYLITDRQTGKQYVGSAYGADGILGRWTTYLTSGYDKNEVENGQYPNIELQKLVREKGLSYIQENFQYSILETFTDDVSDEYIIARESYWKEALLSRQFGYNAN